MAKYLFSRFSFTCSLPTRFVLQANPLHTLPTPV